MCERKEEEEAGGGGGGGGRRRQDTEPKTRTPHKDVGKTKGLVKEITPLKNLFG